MKNICIALLLIILLNSCATIFGGARYNAQIVVPNHNDAKIYLNGKYLDDGRAYTKIRRQNAGNLTFEVRKEGYESQKFSFRSIKFRGGAFAGSTVSSLFTWLNITDQNGNVTSSFIFPIQLIIDLSNYSSLFKPDKNEEGISKINYKNYRYVLNYNQKPLVQEKEVVEKDFQKSAEIKNDSKIQQEKLRDLKKMHEEGIIDNDEYKIMRRKILGISDEDFSQLKNDTSQVVNSTTNKSNVKSDELESNQKENDIRTKEEIKITENNSSSESKKVSLSKEDQEKLNDLNKMLELGVISQKEYDEMVSKLIGKK